jgi:hypothetical protein
VTSFAVLLLRGLNAIRTYFEKDGKPFWNPEHEHFPRHVFKRGKWRVAERAKEPTDVTYVPDEGKDAWEGPTITYEPL